MTVLNILTEKNLKIIQSENNLHGCISVILNRNVYSLSHENFPIYVNLQYITHTQNIKLLKILIDYFKEFQ